MGYREEGVSSEMPVKYEMSNDVKAAEEGVMESQPHVDLHRGLKSRHITMIAIGGAIGTGLIIGTGGALAKAGVRCPYIRQIYSNN
jgi:amino acid transporter